MKILIVTDTFFPHVNGSSYFCQRLCRMLKEKGHDVRVMAPSTTQHFCQTVYHDVPVYGLWSLPVLSYGYRFAPPFFQAAAIRRILEEFRPDIIHCNSHFSPNTLVLPVARSLGIPLVANNHFVPENLLPYLHVPKVLYPLMHSFMWRSWQKTYTQFNAVIEPTQAAADIAHAHAHAPVSTVHVISNGIDLKRFQKRPKNSDLLKKYAVDSTIPLLLCIGRLDKEKQVEVLIRAMAGVIPEHRCRLLIGGKGSDQENLKSLTQELHLSDAVTFLGFVPDSVLPDLYNIADVYVIASIAELQSISALEAMASGLPVVAADAMALPELVKNNLNGYTFRPGDADDCARALRAIVSDAAKRAAFSAKSLELVRQHDIHTSITSFENLYQSLIKPH